MLEDGKKWKMFRIYMQELISKVIPSPEYRIKLISNNLDEATTAPTYLSQKFRVGLLVFFPGRSSLNYIFSTR